jgi:hypothetical protein
MVLTELMLLLWLVPGSTRYPYLHTVTVRVFGDSHFNRREKPKFHRKDRFHLNYSSTKSTALIINDTALRVLQPTSSSVYATCNRRRSYYTTNDNHSPPSTKNSDVQWRLFRNSTKVFTFFVKRYVCVSHVRTFLLRYLRYFWQAIVLPVRYSYSYRYKCGAINHHIIFYIVDWYFCTGTRIVLRSTVR